jgi:PKD repeat protein
MKKIIKNRMKLLIALIGAIILMSSCEYDVIRSADYPDQLIYMPAAVYNNYMINAVPAAIGYDPTPGYPTRFTTDTIARKFNVLLAAYRSGIDLKGAFIVDIAVNTDTISKLLRIPGKLPVGTLLLPADKYSIPSSTEMKDGAEIAKFDLSIDLDFLRANYLVPPAEQNFAIAVAISSTARKTNPKYATTIIVLNTKIMKPTANFTSVSNANDEDGMTINFTNTSVMGTKFTWNFGDGSPVKITTTMVNEEVSHTYSAAGTYNITLTAQGITGFADKSVLTKTQVVPVPLSPIIVNDNDPSITYSGTWTANTDDPCYKGDRHWSNTAGDFFTFKFTGVAVALYFKTANNHGTFDVYLDDMSTPIAKDVSEVSSSTNYQVKLFEKTGLTKSEHTVKCVLKENKYIVFDFYTYTKR